MTTARVVDDDALELAAKIAASDYQPDPVWILDICKTEDATYRLLEIGGLSFADLYDYDKGAIVEAAAALKVWSQPESRVAPQKTTVLRLELDSIDELM